MDVGIADIAVIAVVVDGALIFQIASTQLIKTEIIMLLSLVTITQLLSTISVLTLSCKTIVYLEILSLKIIKIAQKNQRKIAGVVYLKNHKPAISFIGLKHLKC